MPESNISIFNVLPDIMEKRQEKIITPINYQIINNNFDWNNEKKSPNLNYNNKNIKSNVFSKDVVFIFLSLIWIIGIVIVISIIISSKIRFKVKSNLEKIHNYDIEKFIEETTRKLKLKKSIPVYLSDYVKSPCIIGVLKPKIIFPKSIFGKFSINQIEHILIHEIIHYKRKDFISNFICMIALTIHWFNPTIWFIVKRIRIERELACDSYVLELIGEDKNISYGQTLIDTLKNYRNEPNYLFNMTGISGTSKEIERRIIMIKLFKKGKYRKSAWAIALCVAISVITLTNTVSAKTNTKRKVNPQPTIVKTTQLEKEAKKTPPEAEAKKTPNAKVETTTENKIEKKYVEKYELYKSFANLTLQQLEEKLNEKAEEKDFYYIFKKEKIIVGLTNYAYYGEKDRLLVGQIESFDDVCYKGLKVGDSYDDFVKVCGTPFAGPSGKHDTKFCEFGDANNWIEVVFDSNTLKAKTIYISSSLDGSRG